MSKTNTICCIAAAALFIAYSCSNKKAKEEITARDETSNSYKPSSTPASIGASAGYAGATDSTSHLSLSSSAAVERNKDGMRFVRTADVRFQVKNVPDATYHIEDVTTQYGGFVTYTNLHSSITSMETVPVSADSSLDITHYTVENDITLRIPNTRLDSALRAMSDLVDFLDHRLIVATEVSGQTLSNDLAEKRNRDYAQRMRNHADNKAAKQEEATTAEDKALQGREAADNARLANLTLDNQIKYSTVHLLIYQKQTSRKVKVVNESNIARYKPSFPIQMWEAIVSGLEIFEELVVGLAHLWVFILLVIAGVLGYRSVKRKQV